LRGLGIDAKEHRIATLSTLWQARWRQLGTCRDARWQRDVGVTTDAEFPDTEHKRVAELGRGRTGASHEASRDNRTVMNRLRMLPPMALSALLGLGGCATAPINPPLTHADPTAGYRFETREQYSRNKEDIVVLAFSGGGTRAAAFSYGVLEALRDTEVIGRNGQRERLLDSVDVIAGVSGGSFTALAYGLYGDRLFSE
jgi:hypothetical protein